jgi:hypothetical protein
MFLELLLRIFNIVGKQPQERFDDPNYDVHSETDDDHEERDPLPLPDVDTVLSTEWEHEVDEPIFEPPKAPEEFLDPEFWDCFVDLTAKSNVKDKKGRRRRKGTRFWSRLVRIVWHQTAFTWKPWQKGKWSSHHKINAHVCFDTNGAILLLHSFVYYLWTANGFNAECLSFEIMGNFEGEQGTGNWYRPEKFGKGRPAAIQLKRCRQLTYWLLNPGDGPEDIPAPLQAWRDAVAELGYNPLKYVNAHRQSGTKNGKPNRPLDPGSEVWTNVGVWTQEQYGLSDGGVGFHLPGAAAIPLPAWDPRMREDTPVA